MALNGGLFKTTNKATKDTEKYSILEQIIAMAKFKDNGDINVKETVEEIAKTFTVDPNTVEEGATEVSIEVTGKKGTYNYKITTTTITEDFNGYGVCYTAKGYPGYEMYLFKCGVLIQKFPWSNGITCFNGAVFENNEIRLNGQLMGWDFTEDFSSCEFTPTGDERDFTEYVRTEEQYNYEPTKNEDLGIYTNNAIYLSSESVMWIEADYINFWTATDGVKSISISGLETPEALQTAITNKGYDNMVISNDGETITFQKGEASIEYNLIKKEELK